MATSFFMAYLSGDNHLSTHDLKRHPGQGVGLGDVAKEAGPYLTAHEQGHPGHIHAGHLRHGDLGGFTLVLKRKKGS